MDMNVPGKQQKIVRPRPSRTRKFPGAKAAAPAPPLASISSLTNKLINAIPDAIVVVDLEHRILTVNPAFSRLWGYSLGDVEGQPVQILYDPEEQFDQHDPRNYHFQEETNVEKIFSHLYRCKDGSFFHGETHGSPVRNYHREIIGYIGTTRPATPTYQLRESLYANDALLRLNFEKATDAILWTTPKTGIIIDCNRATEKLLQIDKAEIIGLPQAMFF
ncbi:PAS domain-containing protein, partial [Thermodesulfobacteriota bacterium]